MTATNDLPTIGFVGLGNMGGPMARRLASAGHDVTCFDLDPTTVTETVAAGARAAARPSNARRQTLFLTSLPRPGPRPKP